MKKQQTNKSNPTNEQDSLEIEVENDETDEVLIEYDIATYPSDNTINVLVDMWRKKDITIPDFQRGFVWTIKQSSKLIESFLIGLPVPPVFFYIDPENKNLVVDGQQRLLSIVFFYEGYFGHENSGKRQIFKLTGLNKKSAYYDKKYIDLTETEKRKLDGSVLRAINIRQLSPKQENTSIYHIFERLNTGGTPLTSQEIRNVVFRGDFLTKLKSLNENASWRTILGKKMPDKHQKDVELIVRAFGLSNHLDEYEKPMSEFLNKISKRYKNTESEKLKQFEKKFSKTAGLIEAEFSAKPFNVRGPLNTSVFDSVFCTILNNLNSIPSDLSDRYKRLVIDPKFIDYTRLATTDAKIVKERFAYVKKNLID